MKYFLLLCAFSLVCSCADKKEEKMRYIYNNDDKLFQDALERLSNERPEYINNVGGYSKILGFRVMGRLVECVKIENKSPIIVEINTPLFCYDSVSGIYKQTL